MNGLRVGLSVGAKHDKISVVLKPKDPACLPAIWTYCSSNRYLTDFKTLFPRLDAATGSLNQVPFDLNYWQEEAKRQYPLGLPRPQSDDLREWVFDGRIPTCSIPLQAAVARLVGFRWPRQVSSSLPGLDLVTPDRLEEHEDRDGIVCLTSIGGEAPAADRLRALLADAYGSTWTAAKLQELIGEPTTLEVWLRDRFFEDHSELFHQRPFVWHVWDGRKDGFHALVNYHRLAAGKGEGRKALEKLIFTYLGDWISRQQAGVTADSEGAEGRLAAALHLKAELEKILAGHPRYDLFCRWKPLHEQSIGWEPDLNDGVRTNIRPWLSTTLAPSTKPRKGSCILRATPKVSYAKDRGRESHRAKEEFPWLWSWDEQSHDFIGGKEFDGARWNDLHYSLDTKRKARERRKQAGANA
jgi:hypothetical protein